MIEGEIFELLAPLVNGRVYSRDDFLQKADLPDWPAISYKIISRINGETICGTDDVSTDDVRVQVKFVAKTDGAVIALRDQGIAAMMTHDPPPARDNAFGDVDIVTKTKYEVVDFIFQLSSVAT